MSTGTVPTVDHDHADVRMVDQCVRERHPHRPCADYQIVGLQRFHHGLMLTPPKEPVNSLRLRPPATPVA
jgi:hypothetical protein